MVVNPKNQKSQIGFGIHSLRRGMFHISIDVINESPEVVHEIFLHVIPVEVRMDMTMHQILCIGISDLFEEISMGSVCPEYNVEFNDKLKKVEFVKK